MGPLAYILLSGVLGVAGQLIMKQAMVGVGRGLMTPEGLAVSVLTLVFNPMVICGLAVYVSGTLLWLMALSRVDLSYAYPFASLNYILVLLASWLLLGEQPSPRRIAGVVAICFGVWAISRTTAKTVPVGTGDPAAARGIAGGTR